MLGDNLPRQARGKGIRAATLNRTAKGAENLQRGRLGSRQTSIAGIPLTTPGVAVRVYKCKADHGAITHGTTGTLTLYESLESTTLLTETIEAANVMTVQTVPSGAPVVWVLEQGNERVILGWECS